MKMSKLGLLLGIENPLNMANISAELSGMTDLEKSIANKDLSKAPFKKIPVIGRYQGQYEHSFLFPDIDVITALTLGRTFNQESIIHADHLYLCESNKIIATSRMISFSHNLSMETFLKSTTDGTYIPSAMLAYYLDFGQL